MDVWAVLLVGICTGILLSFVIFFYRKQNNKTQEINNEIQSTIDNMTPRDLYIHKLSQNSLVWDRATHTYTKMEQN